MLGIGGSADMWNIQSKNKGKNRMKYMIDLLFKKKIRNGEREREKCYCWEGIAGVGDEHARLANSSIAHSHTLDEPRSTHCF